MKTRCVHVFGVRRLGLAWLVPLVSIMSSLGCGSDPGGGSGGDSGLVFDARSDADGDTENDGALTDASATDATVGGDDAADAGGRDGATSDAADINNPNNERIDTDCDGLSDADEFSTVYPGGARTDPSNPDTDGDGILDGIELGVTSTVAASGCPAIADADPTTTTSPVDPDSDGDGLRDGVEDADRDGLVDSNESNPRLRDTDSDGLPDNVEDADGDGLRDVGELDPTKRDTDGDSIADGVEDANKDGVYTPGGNETNPLDQDTDDDGLADGEEDANQNGQREPYETDPREPDTDCDGLSDSAELQLGTSPIGPDSDGDGVTDGVEMGVTGPVAGSHCASVPVDLDPTTTTDPKDPDSDDDGVTDGEEDANDNGRVDSGETNPRDDDSDGDGLSDGDEVAAGTNPTNPSDPPASGGLGVGVRAICTDDALKVVNFNVQESWTLVTEPVDYQYVAATVTPASANVGAACVTSPVAKDEVAGFIVRMPLIAGTPVGAGEQASAVVERIVTAAPASQIRYATRLTPRVLTSHDGFSSAVSGIADVTVDTQRPVGLLRRQFLYAVTGLAAANFQGLPSNIGGQKTEFVYLFQVLVRAAPEPVELIVVGMLAPKDVYDSDTRLTSIRMADLTNGTALALADAPRGKDCDPFVAEGSASADFIWMSDVSSSTDDDRGRIQAAATQVASALTANGVDYRMGVVPHLHNDHRLGAGAGGVLRGTGFVRDPATFSSYLGPFGYCNNDANLACTRDSDCSRSWCRFDGCEFGLEAASNAIRRALPRTAANQADDDRKFRANATLAVIYVSDEFAQDLTMSNGVCAGEPSRSCRNGSYDSDCGSGGLCLDGQSCTSKKRNASGETYNIQDLFGCDTAVRDLYQPTFDWSSVPPGNNGVCAAPLETANTACINRVIDPFVREIRSQNGIAFAQIQLPKASPTLCTGYSCGGASDAPANEPGRGYAEVVAATGGATYSPCNNDPGRALQAIVDAVSGLSSQYQLRSNPISATLKVGIVDTSVNPPTVRVVPRSKTSGFDYDSVSNSVYFRGSTFRPTSGDLVVVSYRVWEPKDSPCGPCLAGQNCDVDLGVCVCDPTLCAQCSDSEVCTADCGCACAPDCNGLCGPGQSCNPSTCACECAPDCGGACSPGTVCNPSTCSCDCTADCGGACAGSPLACNTSSCSCECPDDCGGACTGNTQCNTSSCSCTCGPACDAACPGGSRCNVENDCACECPDNCGGCPDGLFCNQTTCACECPPDCAGTCRNREVCDPSNSCACVCPADCGGCPVGETCDPMNCRCIPRV